MDNTLSTQQLEALRHLDTCLVSNAIESFDIRLRNEGFADARVRCLFPQRRVPLVGFAATARIKSSGPPPVGHTYFDRTDWWNYLLTVPPPRVVVIEDIDPHPGFGSFVGGVHANIYRALGAVGVVTNGAVRDLDSIEEIGFQVFAGNVTVSHAYVHLVDFGRPTRIAGLEIESGDLLHGDRHGVLSVPKQIAAEIPGVAQEILARDRRVIDLCQSPDFSLEKLRELVKDLR